MTLPQYVFCVVSDINFGIDMVVADGLVYIWNQVISKHRDDVGSSLHILSFLM